MIGRDSQNQREPLLFARLIARREKSAEFRAGDFDKKKRNFLGRDSSGSGADGPRH